MSPQPREGAAEEESSATMLPLLTEAARIDGLRQVLRGFCHRCSNSLNGIKMSLYLLRRDNRGPMPPGWKDLEQSYREIEGLFEHLQMLYRPLTLTMVRCHLGRLIAEHAPRWRARFEARGRSLEITGPSREVPGDLDPMHLGRSLDAFIGWRADRGQAQRRPRLEWRIAEGAFELLWDERESSSRSIPERDHPAVRPDTLRRDSLVLLLMAKVVAAHGGSLESIRQPDADFSVRIRWPQYQPAAPGR